MREKEHVLRQFGKNAAHYVTSKTHAKGEDLKKLIEIVASDKPSGELLDIATGGGHTAAALAPFFKQVVALDLTPEMLEKAKGFMELKGIKNASYVHGDAENLPFPDESVGTVTCRIAAHHFPNVRLFVKEVFRVLKENGRFYLIDNVAPERDSFDLFYNRFEKKRDPSHVRAYKKSEWISMLEMEGLFIEEMISFEKNFTFETWCRMMNVSERGKQVLNHLMISSSKQMRDFFTIKIKDETVQSFQGQSVLLTARKS